MPAAPSASIAGREIKKSVLELGGSDPFIVLADADLPRVANLAVKGRFLNAGQSCISPKRFIVEASVAEEFTAAGGRADRALTVGDPEAPDTDVGPMARRDLRDGVADQVQRRGRGRRHLAVRRTPPRRSGRLLLPAHRSRRRHKPGMSVYAEEVFGPVATIITVADADEAVTVANDTPFGLGASVWSARRRRRDRGR